MEKQNALNALAALGQETRLDVFRLLVKAGQEGLPAGAISDALDVRPNTLSTHLGALSRSGLVHAERDGRSIHYRADLETMQALVTYLLQDCCGGNPDLCAPIASLAAASCGQGGSADC
ncbi:helix-turn-helix transcriptional regulator [Rhodobacterales bacterium]|nr:helix-turn-helix transcriptional regulator [Rhodobacterales bacterium]